MTEATFQDRLPLDPGTLSEVREARADAMSAAGIRPPQRYEVTSSDYFDAAKPRRSFRTILPKLIKVLR